jgi:hypothetical protein
MSLDLFPSNIDEAVNYAARTSAPELPSTFTDNFNDAWNRGYLTSQSISGEIRKTTARQQFIDDAIAKTGDQSFGQLEEYGGFDIAGFNDKIANHRAARPDLEIQPISDEGIQTRADEIGTRQLSDSASFGRRERTTGGSVGAFLGSAVASVADPVNLIAFPLAAPESLGILGTALAWGAIGAGSQTAIEALNATSMERIQPGYGTSNQPLGNILEAGAAGAVLGGGLKALASLWGRNKSGTWPRTVRDAGNVVESEAQIATTNPLPGVEGETAHRTAVSKAIDDLANGRPVDVDGIVVPEQLAARDAAIDPVIAARDNAVTAQAAARDAADVVQTYTTAKGSKYSVHSDGTTTRDKAARADVGHEGDSGIKDRSAKTIYVDGDASALSGAGLQGDTGGKGYRVAIKDGKATFLWWNEQAGKWGAPESGRDIPFTTIPEVGKSPVELWKPTTDVPGYEAYRSQHAGNKITAVQQPELPFAQTEAQARAEASTATLSEGNEMPAEDAAKIAARVAQMDDPDKARALLDEVFLRPQTIADTLPGVEKPPSNRPEKINTDTAAALREDLTPAKIEEMRADTDMPDTVSRELDRMVIEKPDLEVPMGVTQDADGRMVPTTRKVSDVIAEADAKLAASKEIAACAGPLQTAERAA